MAHLRTDRGPDGEWTARHSLDMDTHELDELRIWLDAITRICRDSSCDHAICAIHRAIEPKPNLDRVKRLF